MIRDTAFQTEFFPSPRKTIEIRKNYDRWRTGPVSGDEKFKASLVVERLVHASI